MKTADDFYAEVAETNLKNIELLDKIECYEEEKKKASCDETKLKEEIKQLVEILKKYEV